MGRHFITSAIFSSKHGGKTGKDVLKCRDKKKVPAVLTTLSRKNITQSWPRLIMAAAAWRPGVLGAVTGTTTARGMAIGWATVGT